MTDNRRRYRAIWDSLRHLYPEEGKGRVAQHLNVLAALVSGIVGSQSTNLPAIAGKFPCKANVESRVKRFERWIRNEAISHKIYFLPYAEILIAALSHLPLVLVIDGSVVGRGCNALLIGIVYRKRVLPLCWTVAEGKKGHFPEEMHIALIEQLEPIIPEDARVILLGDGEFDGVDLQAIANGWGWEYALGTAKNITLTFDGHEFSCSEMGDYIRPGDDFVAPGVLFTEKRYGPVMVIAWWRKDCKEPIYPVSNMESAEEACGFYQKRFRVETFFSDVKGRGFFHKSHLSDPERISRLMMAACLAYHWLIYLGVMALGSGWRGKIHRMKRCDLSLFQLGLRLLDYLLDQGLPIPILLVPGFAEQALDEDLEAA